MSTLAELQIVAMFFFGPGLAALVLLLIVGWWKKDGRS